MLVHTLRSQGREPETHPDVDSAAGLSTPVTLTLLVIVLAPTISLLIIWPLSIKVCVLVLSMCVLLMLSVCRRIGSMRCVAALCVRTKVGSDFADC